MAQSALSVFWINAAVAENTIGLRQENLFYGDTKAHLLLRRYSETATRTRTGIVGAISGCTLQAAYSDPVLTIDIAGWVISRGGFANSGPGALIDSSMIANWRNGASGGDSFGWDVMSPGNKFIVQDPTFTRVPGSLSEVSLKLVLECTGKGGGVPTTPVDNGGTTPPVIGSAWRILTVYTNRGSYQYLTQREDPDLDDIFGSSAARFEDGPPSKRYITSVPDFYLEDKPTVPPEINVLGVNIQAATGTGSGAGGEWLVGSASEVTDDGQSLFPSGLDVWAFVPFEGGYTSGNANRSNTLLVTGNYPTLASALASMSPPKTEADFPGIWNLSVGWLKGDEWLKQGDPASADFYQLPGG